MSHVPLLTMGAHVKKSSSVSAAPVTLHKTREMFTTTSVNPRTTHVRTDPALRTGLANVYIFVCDGNTMKNVPYQHDKTSETFKLKHTVFVGDEAWVRLAVFPTALPMVPAHQYRTVRLPRETLTALRLPFECISTLKADAVKSDVLPPQPNLMKSAKLAAEIIDTADEDEKRPLRLSLQDAYNNFSHGAYGVDPMPLYDPDGDALAQAQYKAQKITSRISSTQDAPLKKPMYNLDAGDFAAWHRHYKTNSPASKKKHKTTNKREQKKKRSSKTRDRRRPTKKQTPKKQK